MTEKPTLLRRVGAYFAAATVFTVMTEFMLQAISLLRTQSFAVWDAAHISCLIFTFVFLFLLGFVLTGAGRAVLTLFKVNLSTTTRQHALSYAIGYMIALCFGIGTAVAGNSNMAETMIASWWAFAIAASLLFIAALFSGAAFGRVYEAQ